MADIMPAVYQRDISAVAREFYRRNTEEFPLTVPDAREGAITATVGVFRIVDEAAAARGERAKNPVTASDVLAALG